MNKYIYLLTCEHSGSTLLAFILASHPQIASVGELAGNIPADRSYKCSCGVSMQECLFWRRVIAKMSERGFPVEVGQFDLNILPNTQTLLMDFFLHYFPHIKIEKVKLLFLKSFFPSIWENISYKIQKNMAFAEVICDIKNASIFFDSSKDIYRLRFLKELTDYPIKVIHLVRNGKAVVKSLMKREKYSPDKAVKTWVWMNKMIERIKKLYFKDEDWLFIRYEDLCYNLDDCLNRVAYFLGISNTFNLLPFVKSHFHIVGNTMRHTFNGIIRPPLNQKVNLPYDVEKLFNSLALDFYKKYGYLSE